LIEKKGQTEGNDFMVLQIGCCAFGDFFNIVSAAYIAYFADFCGLYEYAAQFTAGILNPA